MRFACVLLGLAAVLVACAHTPRARWKAAGAYHVCKCDGTERAPTPSEADGFADGERVDTYCEGDVRDCHLAKKPPPDD
jgi:hypothetical protein